MDFLEKTRLHNGLYRSHTDRPPWETARTPSATSTPQNHQPQHQQQLPSISDLTQGVPALGSAGHSPSIHSASSIRDSGNWSMQSPSKHASIISNGSNSLHLPALNSDRPSPHRNSAASGPDERSPFSPSVSSRQPSGQHSLSPSGPAEYSRSGLSQTNQAYENGSRNSGSDFPPQESRRSSIDSRMNQGMTSLALGASSPYNSANPSQASLTLARERGIPVERNTSAHSIRPGFSTPKKAQSILGINTVSERQRLFVGGRTAPPIDTNPRAPWPNPHAANPTKGFPYAFPDPDAEPPEAEEDDKPSSMTGATNHFSRRGSIGGTSVTSSVFTNDSRMPHGQRKLEDGMLSPLDTEGANLHHHQLQHKQVSTVIDDDPDSPNSTTPYSRTPELRVSHKLAERKRRSEMKGLFEDLRNRLPADGRVSKTSKWEVLMKAIEYIKQLESSCDTHHRQAMHYRNEAQEAHTLRAENLELRAEMQRLQQRLSSAPQAQSLPQPPVPTTAPPAPPSAMQGVQYSS